MTGFGFDENDLGWMLSFSAVTAGATLGMSAEGDPPNASLLYKTEGSAWSTFTPGSTTITLANIGDRVWLKAGPSGNSRFANNASDYWHFDIGGQLAANGSIMSLLDGDNNSFYSHYLDTFRNTNAFLGLFTGCAGLVSAPRLPATHLATGCYSFMFMNCTGLTSAPIIPSEDPGTVAYMFSGCSNLSSITVAFKKFLPQASPNWVQGVAASGTFKCPTELGTNETITRGASGCPEGWTVVNTDAQ